MATIGLYLGCSQEEANAIRAQLNEIAASLGYLALAGPTAGQGNAAAMLAAIAKGDVIVSQKTYEIQVPATGWTRDRYEQARIVVKQHIDDDHELQVALVKMPLGVEVEDATIVARDEEGYWKEDRFLPVQCIRLIK